MLTTLARYHRLADMAVVARNSEGESLASSITTGLPKTNCGKCMPRPECGRRSTARHGVGTGVDGMAAARSARSMTPDARRCSLSSALPPDTA
jgi:hypothetical protein